MKRLALLLALAVVPAFGQGPSSPLVSATSVVPSSTGAPQSIAVLWPYEFVSVQTTGQIFTYNISSGSQTLVGSYTTPSCSDPSGMVITNIAGANIMAYICYDGNALYTATIGSGGLLTALGSVTGLPYPYPGIALDGTDVYVPLHGVTSSANGAVAKVSIATPSSPTVAATTTLASVMTGVYQNPGYLAVAGGYVYVEAGSEPSTSSSSIQVLNESTMALVGSPLAVAHSPQYIAIQGNVAYVTFYDTPQLESINISTPSSLSILQTLSMPSCHSIPVILRDRYAFVGCYEENTIQVVDVSNPSDMQIVQTFTGVTQPQRFKFDDQYLFATAGVIGGSVYQILTDGTYYQQIDASNIYANSLQAGTLNASSAAVTNNLSVQGSAFLGAGSTVAGSPICTPANPVCGITGLTGDVSASGPGAAVATVTGVHATSGTLNGVTIGGTTPAAGSFTSGAFTSSVATTPILSVTNTGTATDAQMFSAYEPSLPNGAEAGIGTGKGFAAHEGVFLEWWQTTASSGFGSIGTYTAADPIRFYATQTASSGSLMVNNGGSGLTLGNVCGTGISLCVNSSSTFTVDTSGNLKTPQLTGPATAPSGSCTSTGAWVFSQDGHATFCSSGTWVTKI